MFFQYINNKKMWIKFAYRRLLPNPSETLLGKGNVPSQRGEERITGVHYSKQDIWHPDG